MTKRPSIAPPKRQPTTSPAPRQSHAAAIRETIESIAIAFVLAFLFRTFEAEAFVIPTGSMAPTLMGRHKDLECPECHYKFQISASEEVTREGYEKFIEREDWVDGRAKKIKSNREFKIDLCICPMCRYAWQGEKGLLDESSYNGDRILVNKFAYQFNEPQRWDVIVFKYPDGAQENYIKRLIGLPNETLCIHRGSIWKLQPDGSFEIARKPPEKLQVMLQPVFDNDLMPTMSKDLGLPVRWRPQVPPGGDSAGQWTTSDLAVHEIDGSAAGEAWLRYEHRVPTPNQWKNASGSRLLDGGSIKPQLITDFTAYDSSSSPDERMHRCEPTGLNWTGDLAVRCQADVESDRGEIVLELVKGGRRFQCRLDVATGSARLSIDGEDEFKPQAQTAACGPGKHELMFANCDQKLYLWIDGVAVDFDAPTEYGDLENVCPTRADLQPVGIAASGVKMKLDHLKIFRDIYYIATNERIKQEHLGKRIFSMIDLRDLPELNPKDRAGITSAEEYLARFFSDPDLWHEVYTKANMEKTEKVVLDADKFFVMGDNSAKSADSRVWGTVPRDLLIGKAFFVYWPHSWHRIPATKIPFPFSRISPAWGS